MAASNTAAKINGNAISSLRVAIVGGGIIGIMTALGLLLGLI
jgi:threonine dehydrogenase-like Zn-dependent dehydrogenase